MCNYILISRIAKNAKLLALSQLADIPDLGVHCAFENQVIFLLFVDSLQKLVELYVVVHIKSILLVFSLFAMNLYE